MCIVGCILAYTGLGCAVVDAIGDAVGAGVRDVVGNVVGTGVEDAGGDAVGSMVGDANGVVGGDTVKTGFDPGEFVGAKIVLSCCS